MALPKDDTRTPTASAGDPVTEWQEVCARATDRLAGRTPLAVHPLIEEAR